MLKQSGKPKAGTTPTENIPIVQRGKSKTKSVVIYWGHSSAHNLVVLMQCIVIFRRRWIEVNGNYFLKQFSMRVQFLL